MKDWILILSLFGFELMSSVHELSTFLLLLNQDFYG